VAGWGLPAEGDIARYFRLNFLQERANVTRIDRTMPDKQERLLPQILETVVVIAATIVILAVFLPLAILAFLLVCPAVVISTLVARRRSSV
jgi:hypothetical protein